MILKLTKPTVLVDKLKACKNIIAMAEKARTSGSEFRPHFKTHQSVEIGEWFREHNVRKISVSSVDMAVYFANHGWNDISVCVPVNLRQSQRIDDLASRIDLHLLVESVETVSFLEKSLKNTVHIWIEIDTGYHRSGVNWDNDGLVKDILRTITTGSHLNFQGILTHAGHTYRAGSTNQVEGIYLDTLEKMKEVKGRIELMFEGLCKISIGDTPGCSIIKRFDPEIDEVRPGNFVFYDIMQLMIGSCVEEDIALGVACPVIAKYPEREEIVIYGGAVHLSKEALKLDANTVNYGLVCPLTDNGWGKSYSGVNVVELTQEHGKISAPRDVMDSINIGDMLIVLPVHSCLTANLFKSLTTLEGETLSCFRM